MTRKVIALLMIAIITLTACSAVAVTTSREAAAAPLFGGTIAHRPCRKQLGVRVWLFAIDMSGTLWHTNGGRNWDSLGRANTSSPAAVSWSGSSSRTDVFVRGANGSLMFQYYQNGWSTWKSLGGKLTHNTGPAASRNLALFVQGTDHQLWHKYYQNKGWTAWYNRAGKPPEGLSTASPAAVLNVEDHTVVCVIGNSGNVWHRASLADWDKCNPWAAPLTSSGVADTDRHVQSNDR